jgi:hypothetical protein
VLCCDGQYSVALAGTAAVGQLSMWWLRYLTTKGCPGLGMARRVRF